MKHSDGRNARPSQHDKDNSKAEVGMLGAGRQLGGGGPTGERGGRGGSGGRER
jgi:hypothetical protein